jgi:hypothetical protein
MKSYILYGVTDMSEAAAELDRQLPRNGVDAWLLLHTSDDPIAYFQLHPDSECEFPRDHRELGPNVQVDISGRHYHKDDMVIAILKSLQKIVGGVIRDDNGLKC